ncbi:GMC family oxidoreductase [Nonomuraea angiospora]|uniref:GMC family oxidoreductase n=1 Tax=Nonomuraea angiospora TaxID=46172 RepID=UPI0029AD1428|nr:GMC family oxidoreductase [Nonomuraea angiospora]MDX3106101.1 GMC family oxidoreductase [Nonomuraea angiospora]
MRGTGLMRVDAVVIGSGAGGGVAAAVLAEAGKHVLVLERGRDLTFEEIGRDHLRNHRLTRYPHRSGPDYEDGPRVVVDATGGEKVVRPHEPGFHGNATLVGGGTRLYGAQAWRFLPADFTMASTYGVPAGSSLADWPIGYDDLEPYYERAEWEIGVCGDHAAGSRHWRRARPYPMSPLPEGLQAAALRRGAAALGWDVLPVPLLINSVPYGGRAACTRCQHCVGFACPADAKNGSHNTVLSRALATGRARLQPEAVAERLECDPSGRVTGVRWVDRSGTRHVAEAEVVICAAGAIETARLLQNSPTRREPHGLGNNHDQVGRHLQGHAYAWALGEMDEPVHDGLGPGVSLATLDFVHHNDGVVGGAMLADEFTVLPLAFWARNLPPGLPRWGARNKQYMRDNYRRVMRVGGPVQEIPNPEARTRLDPHVRDRWGIPVARLSGATHPESLRTGDFIAGRAREWLLASGARRAWAARAPLTLHAGQHQSGTCRMGDDERTSVVDRWGRVHGHDNLYVADASVHVTNGGVNPVLTVMALAFRTAERLCADW